MLYQMIPSHTAVLFFFLRFSFETKTPEGLESFQSMEAAGVKQVFLQHHPFNSCYQTAPYNCRSIQKPVLSWSPEDWGSDWATM